MTECQIFTTFIAAERIWKEMEELVDEFSSSMKVNSDGEITIQNTTWGDSDENPSHPSTVWCDCLLSLRPKGKGKPKARALTFYFDLARDLVAKEKSNWPHSREALLVVGLILVWHKPHGRHMRRFFRMGASKTPKLETPVGNTCLLRAVFLNGKTSASPIKTGHYGRGFLRSRWDD